MYDCYGMGYRTYYATCGSIYSPYGAYYNGYYNGYGGYYPGTTAAVGSWWTRTRGRPSTPVAEGRVVNGRGYTQVRPREAEPSPGRSGHVGNGAAYDGGGSSSIGRRHQRRDVAGIFEREQRRRQQLGRRLRRPHRGTAAAGRPIVDWRLCRAPSLG